MVLTNTDEVGGEETTVGAPAVLQTRDGDGAPDLSDLKEYLPLLRDASEEAVLDAQRSDVTFYVDEITRKLKGLQLRCGIHTRFHLVVERDIDETVQGWAQAGSTNVNACARIENQVLFSPTLSYQLGGTREISESVTDRLNAASLKALKDAYSKLQSGGVVSSPSSHHSSQSPASVTGRNNSSPEKDAELSDFDEWEHFYIPAWFPFLEDAYTEGPQASEFEVLDIPAELVRKFQRLPKDAFEKVWSQFFRTLHAGVRKKLRNHSRLPFKYTLYTPPWLRKQIKVETQLHRVGVVTIRPVRGQRSDWGYKTMVLILAGFYFLEPGFGKPVLLHLLDSLPVGIASRDRRSSDRIPLPTRPRKIRLDDNRRPMSSERNRTATEELVPIERAEAVNAPAPLGRSEQVENLNPSVSAGSTSNNHDHSVGEETEIEATVQDGEVDTVL